MQISVKLTAVLHIKHNKYQNRRYFATKHR